MKETISLCGMKNAVWELKKTEAVCQIDAEAWGKDKDEWIPVVHMPAQVHDVLYENGMIPEEYRVGWCEKVLWTAEYDWVYRCRFGLAAGQEKAEFYFGGLDTYADIYLNGKLIGRHEDFYLPQRADVSSLLRKENTLLIHFHRICDILDGMELNPEWDGAVMKCKMIRKPIHDFAPDEVKGSNYQGAVPYFTPTGVYGEIGLDLWEKARIRETLVNVSVNEDYDGRIDVKISGEDTVGGERPTVGYRVCLGEQMVAEGELAVSCATGVWEAGGEITVSQPELWFPRGFGEQTRYGLCFTLKKNGDCLDTWDKLIGFKRVEMPAPLEYFVNGKRVRLWGGSMDPLQGYTHCYCKDRAMRLFDMVENAHMNTLRIWGEGIPQPDDFYEEADKRGILIWQEFFLGHGAYPDTKEIADACELEARELVKRLLHRVCLLMWCGGNETVMGAEFIGKYPFGINILLENFPKVVKELDPGRYYHPNSPWGGEWANDPREGDYHTYDCVWQYPYQDYPLFISEHIRTAPPVEHSLRRMIKGEFWNEQAAEKGMLSTYSSPSTMPDNWLYRSHPGANGQRKSGPYWEFYDPAGPDDMMYRFAASYGQEIRRYGEQIRRGTNVPGSKARSRGYFSCKLLDTWPKVYCASIDFFQEGYIPYYSLVKLFEPVMLSFEKGESIRLWMINDSAEDIEGSVMLGIYHLEEEKVLRQDRIDVNVSQGDAEMIFDLVVYRFFPKDCILYARFTDKHGSVICTSVDYVDIERHLRYKEAEISVTLEENTLAVRSNAFVRCVELKGKCGEDEFGWLFTDNYFDLMPGDTKYVTIVGNRDCGQISVKGHYLKQGITIDFKRTE